MRRSEARAFIFSSANHFVEVMMGVCEFAHG